MPREVKHTLFLTVANQVQQIADRQSNLQLLEMFTEYVGQLREMAFQ